MKTYTSEDVIDLVGQYFNEEIIDRAISSFNLDQTKPFGAWLKQKEQSELPIKDQLEVGQEIWVKGKITGEEKWYKRYFFKLEDEVIYTKNEEGTIGYWYEYSLTDPNNG